MVIYRPHGGALEDTMRHKIEFSTVDNMKAHIVAYWTDSCFGVSPFSVEDIVFGDDVFDDPRIGWHDTRHVCIRRFHDRDYVALFGCPQCIGWFATDYEK